MRGFSRGAEPLAAGGHWGSGGETQLLEEGDLGQTLSQPEIIGGRANYGGAKLLCLL